MKNSPGPDVDAMDVDALRAVLVTAGFTATGVAQRLPAIRVGLRSQDIPLYQRQLSGTDPLSVLIRLWLLGLPVPREAVARAIAPLDLQALVDARILQDVEGTVTSRAQLLAVEDLLLFGDRDDVMLASPDGVAASSPSARLLNWLTIRRPVRSSLDAGCGSGMHAVLAARHSERVTAIDVNERALAFTRFNGRLNRVPTIECRHGDWFEPVHGERFDMLVSNPPFVVSPETDLLFQDSPLPADDVSRMVVTDAASHLADGGFAHVLCNWALRAGDEWSDPPRRWVSGLGCDALLLHFGTEDPMSYAAMWNGPLRHRNPSAFLPTVDRWTDYYRSEGIQALCSGAVILRYRPGGPHWTRALDVPQRPESAAGEDLLRLCDAQDWLEDGSADQRLLDSRFGLVDGHEVRQVLTYVGGVYSSHGCSLGRTSGLRLGVALDPEALQVILRLDGSQSLRDLAQRVAGEIGLDEAALIPKTAEAARELLRHGLLTPSPRIDLVSRPTSHVDR